MRLQRAPLKPSKVRDESNYRYRHYTLRSKYTNENNTNKNFTNSEKNNNKQANEKLENKENLYCKTKTKNNYSNNQNNPDLVQSSLNILKVSKTILPTEENIVHKNFVNYEISKKKNSNYNNNKFINLNKYKNFNKTNNNLSGFNASFTNNIIESQTNKNLNNEYFNSNLVNNNPDYDFFDNDSINLNVNTNNLTFNRNHSSETNNIKIEENEIICSVNNKEIANLDVNSENLGMSMEVDERYIPQFPVCLNKFNSRMQENYYIL